MPRTGGEQPIFQVSLQYHYDLSIITNDHSTFFYSATSIHVNIAIQPKFTFQLNTIAVAIKHFVIIAALPTLIIN